MNNKVPVTLFVDSPELANEIYLLAKQAGIEAIKPGNEENKATDITSAHKVMLMKAEKLSDHNVEIPKKTKVELSYSQKLMQNYLNKNK